MKFLPNQPAIIVAGLVCLLAAAVSGQARDPAAETAWNMREAVAFALKNSPDSRISRQRIEAAEARLQLAEVAFHPRLTLSASYDQTDNPMYSFGNILNQGNFDSTIDFNDPGRTDNLGIQAEVRYRFYNGGRDQAGRQGAEAGHRASTLERTVTEHRLGLEVVRAYQNIIRAAEQVQAREAELQAISASLSVARARYEAGDLLKTEMLNLEVQRSLISENLIATRHQHEIARKIFLNLLGLESGTVVLAPEDDREQTIPEQYGPGRRPELAALAARLDGAEADLARAAGGGMPTLDGFASYRYDQGLIENGSGDSWMAGVKLGYDLYDGHQMTAEIAEKRAALAELQARFDKLKLALTLEVQQAELNLQQARERLAVTSQMARVADESARLSRVRFTEGVILSSDLIDVEVRLTEALVRQAAARAGLRIAVANLRHAAGLQQFTDTTEELLEDQQ